jgi:hypothetical protein
LDPISVGATVLTLASGLGSVISAWLARRRGPNLQQAARMMDDRIKAHRDNHESSGRLIREINAEFDLQAAAAERIRDAEENQRLAALHKDEAEAQTIPPATMEAGEEDRRGRRRGCASTTRSASRRTVRNGQRGGDVGLAGAGRAEQRDPPRSEAGYHAWWRRAATRRSRSTHPGTPTGPARSTGADSGWRR